MHGLVFLVPIVAIVGATISSVAKTWAAAQHREGRAGSPDLRALEARLARIEQAVDAIAIEVERVAEGQRFTTSLLSDRVPRAADRELRP